MVELGQKELLVIAYLRKNARMRLTQLSRLTHIPVSTLYDQIAGRYHKVISKFTVLIDFAKLHYTTRVTVMLRVQKEEKRALENYLLYHPHINSLYRINNGYDFMMEVIFSTLFQFEQFLDKLESHFPILETQCYHVIEDLKREEFLAQPLPKSPNGNQNGNHPSPPHSYHKEIVIPRMVKHLADVTRGNTVVDHASSNPAPSSPNPDASEGASNSPPPKTKPARQRESQQYA